VRPAGAGHAHRDAVLGDPLVRDLPRAFHRGFFLRAARPGTLSLKLPSRGLASANELGRWNPCARGIRVTCAADFPYFVAMPVVSGPLVSVR
jgi:hypothetical protein